MLFTIPVVILGLTCYSWAQDDTSATVPHNFGVVLFPTFQALDVFGPLDALNVLSQSHAQLNLSLISANFTPISTAPRGMSSFGSNFSESILPTHTFENPPQDLEVLIVPGGIGTRAPDITTASDYVKAVYPSLKYLITVCTGAGIAARAGVLDGHNATTNKKAYDEIIVLGPNVNWIHKARWVVDGNIYTSAGVSAGLDVIFAFISDVYGEDVAQDVSITIEYERHTDPSWDPFADLYPVNSTGSG